MRLAIICAAAIPSGTTLASAAEPIALRDMDSFHVGGRLVEISGKPVKEVTFTPGVPVMMDKNNAEVAALIQKWLEGKELAK